MTPGKKIRVLIVDDSILFRTTLANRLAEDPYIEIIGQAVDAIDALEKIKALNPDVVTLDVEMPKMNGIEFLKKLMPTHPLPVVVVSSAPITTFDALSAGAVDYVKKPVISSPTDLAAFIRELQVKVKISSTAHVRRVAPTAPTLSGAQAPAAAPASLLLRRAPLNSIIAIGASTGGTEAILEVVKELPANTPGIVVVQHMPPVFTRMYAERLDRICKMRVKEAENGDRVEPGKIIIAAGEFQMRLFKDASGYYVKSEPGARVNGHCPSVEVLFNSVASVAGNRAVGVILTGMGGDGAKGLLAMRQAGAYTIGQDKESCVVYGMPMVAFNIGAVTKQLPLGQVSGELVRYLNAMN